MTLALCLCEAGCETMAAYANGACGTSAFHAVNIFYGCHENSTRWDLYTSLGHVFIFSCNKKRRVNSKKQNPTQKPIRLVSPAFIFYFTHNWMILVSLFVCQAAVNKHVPPHLPPLRAHTPTHPPTTRRSRSSRVKQGVKRATLRVTLRLYRSVCYWRSLFCFFWEFATREAGGGAYRDTVWRVFLFCHMWEVYKYCMSHCNESQSD